MGKPRERYCAVTNPLKSTKCKSFAFKKIWKGFEVWANHDGGTLRAATPHCSFLRLTNSFGPTPR